MSMCMCHMWLSKHKCSTKYIPRYDPYSTSMKKYLQWKKIHCGKSTLSCLSAFLNVHKEFELGDRGRSDGYKLSSACQQHAREKRQKETPLATSSALWQCPPPVWKCWGPSEVCHSKCQPASSGQRQKTLNTQHYIWSLIKIVNEFFARSDVKQEIYQIRIICLFVVTGGSNSNQSNTRQHPPQVMIVCEAHMYILMLFVC